MSDEPLDITFTIKVDGVMKDKVRVTASYSDEAVDERTLDKVRTLMMQCRLTETRARMIIHHLNQSGIVFREVL